MLERVVTVSELTKVYTSRGEKKVAIENITFNVNKGDILAYVGENGAGKSTTIKLILGLMRPSSGVSEIFGNASFKFRQKNALRIGTVMGQKSQLWWELPLIDSFTFLQKIYGINATEGKAWLDKLINTLHISEFLQQPVRELSLGQRMRGELAAALIHQPELLILDEATLGLDVQTKNDLLNFLGMLNRTEQLTIMMTTHDLREVERIANRMILLQDGSQVFSGKIDDFLKNYENLKKVEIQTIQNILLEGLTFYQQNKESTVYIFDDKKLTIDDLNQELAKIDIYDNKAINALDLSDVLTIMNGNIL